MSSGLTFVRATPKDAAETVRLIGLADPEALIEISGKKNYAEALRSYEQNFVRTDVYFSYQNIILAKIGLDIIGCILSFRGIDEEKYATNSEHDSSLMVRESSDDEIYIDSLAVDERYRGQGIAKKLIFEVIEYAKSIGYRKVGLLADLSQPHLGELYRKLGFQYQSKLMLLDVEYEKLVFTHE